MMSILKSGMYFGPISSFKLTFNQYVVNPTLLLKFQIPNMSPAEVSECFPCMDPSLVIQKLLCDT